MAKVVFITGVSSGIGKQCADYLSGLGYIVYGTSRHQVSENLPYTVLQMDVTSKTSIELAVQKIIEREKKIDVLINNAGIGIGGTIEEYTDEEIKKQFDTNFFGTLNTCRVIIPFMRKNGEGLIINISSLGGLMGLPFQGIYSATKYAIEGMSEALRMEIKSAGIKVVLINPGDFKTNFTDNRITSINQNENSSYKEQFKKTLGVIEHDERNGSDPIKIAIKISKIIKMKSPKVRYMVGGLEQILFTRSIAILPSKWFTAILRDHYKVK
jgi:short-subunit dehydrogenase